MFTVLFLVLMSKNAWGLGAGRAGWLVERPAEGELRGVPAAAPLCLHGVPVQLKSGLQGKGRSCACTHGVYVMFLS